MPDYQLVGTLSVLSCAEILLIKFFPICYAETHSPLGGVNELENL